MRTNYEDFAAELNRSFPRTPERFQQIVSQEVYAQMNPVKNRSRKRKRKPYKALLPIAACLVLAGSTVAAARLPVFQNWLSGLGINAKNVEESMIHSDEASGAIIMESIVDIDSSDSSVQSEPLFRVTDVYYDGATLIFWADPQSDFFELGDHVYINGIDSRLEYVVETEEGSGIYECKVSVLNQELQQAETDSIHVKVGVYTAPDSKEDYSFTVESDKLGTAVRNTGNVSGLDFGQIVSYDVTVTPSVINLHLNWEVSDDRMMEILPWGEYILEDASGKRLTRDEWLRSSGCSIPEYDEAGGINTFSQDLEIVGFDASSPTMTIIPVRVQWDADGSKIEDSEEVLEDYAITIDLTK
ncbi:MAG: hypothetical protein K2N44_04445 [Lachnospiraceae bacterium]|nr:hypothetical protein [Lachnospiraceae bacterium]